LGANPPKNRLRFARTRQGDQRPMQSNERVATEVLGEDGRRYLETIEKCRKIGQPYMIGFSPDHLWGLALVMCAATLWATVGVASRFVPHEIAMPDEVYGFVRTVIAGPAILLVARVTGGTRRVKASAGSFSGFLLFGISCATFQVCLFRSFTLLGVTITVFLTVCLPPVIAVFWSLRKLGEPISRQVVLPLAISIAGLVTFVSVDTASEQPLDLLLGLALSLLASAAFVVMTNAARSLSVAYSPNLVSGLGLIIASLVLAPVAMIVAPGGLTHFGAAMGDWRSISVLIYLGLGPTALAYVCYCAGMARCRSAVTGLVASMIEPAVAAGLAFLFLDETLTAWQALGCFMLLTAMVALWLDKQRT
ncbi:MAG: DMT family transporter, partial [Mesorhizobium sp.]